jgi:Mor family transcriptional regulator
MQGKISLLEREAICNFYDKGVYSLAQLEKAYQLSNKSVRQILAGKTCGCDGSRLYQAQCPVGGRQGDYLKKIFDKELSEIMQMFSIGEKKSVIARWVGVTVATVTRYLNKYYLTFGEENGTNN